MGNNKHISINCKWGLNKTLILLAFLSISLGVRSQTYVTPTVVTNLSELINETSGLANLNGELWTHNDSGDESVIYQLDPGNGNILRIVEIMNAANEDWEDIAYDDNYVYIGDIGNNDGDRTDLRIYKVSRTTIAASDEVYAEIIEYSYSDQTSWEPNHNNHNFDCEALISYGDNLYLFSKNWVDYQTRCYQLTKQAGTQIAAYQSTYNINCLVTGAEVLQNSNTLVLIGYNTSGGSFTWTFENFSNDNFFNGNNTQLIWTTLSQIEGICIANDDNEIYISSEKFSSFLDPTLYHLDLSNNTTNTENIELSNTRVYPRNNSIVIDLDPNESGQVEIQLLEVSGKVLFGNQYDYEQQIQIPKPVTNGVYLILIKNDKEVRSYKIAL